MSIIESELNHLEEEIDKIIRREQHLLLQNKALYKKIETLNSEITSLTASRNRAVTAIQKIITQLKDKILC